MFRRRVVTAFAAIATAGAVLAPAPAFATATGEVAFECTAYLPEWPSPGANGACGDGTAPALASVSATGLADDGLPYVLYGAGRVQSQFAYNAPCVANEPPLLGAFAGRATITAVPAIHGGIPKVAVISTEFTATLVGTEFVFNTSGPRITFTPSGTASGSVAPGTGTFAPVLTANNTCPVGGPMTALVQGEWDLVE